MMNTKMKFIVAFILLLFILIVPYLFVPIVVIGLVYYSLDILPNIFFKPKRNDSTTTTTYPLYIYITKEDKQAYLASNKWRTLRKIILKRDDYTYRKCKAKHIQLEVHHIHYRTFKKETGEELISLCRNCHQEIHNKYGYDYNSIYPIHNLYL